MRVAVTHYLKRHALVLCAAVALILPEVSSLAEASNDCWIRPAAGDQPGPALWGHRDGLRVGLPNGRGPSGLLYLYYPEIVKSPDRVFNFIAVEPIVKGARGLSELEPSALDSHNGKRIWSGDKPDFAPRDPKQPARGVVTDYGSTSSLAVYLMVEPFQNGARVHLRLTFRSDRPGEVGLETFASPDCAGMSHCVLTATMGNYARLRDLWLSRRVVRAGELWPDYTAVDFAPARDFHLDELWRNKRGGVLVAATPSEANPAETTAPGHWNYRGAWATQYWRLEPDEVTASTFARVNGRYVYWRSKNPVPGGIAFENFEIERHFRTGEQSVFGATTQTVEKLRERE